jgi:hypothetical protein
VSTAPGTVSRPAGGTVNGQQTLPGRSGRCQELPAGAGMGGVRVGRMRANRRRSAVVRPARPGRTNREWGTSGGVPSDEPRRSPQAVATAGGTCQVPTGLPDALGRSVGKPVACNQCASVSRGGLLLGDVRCRAAVPAVTCDGPISPDRFDVAPRHPYRSLRPYGVELRMKICAPPGLREKIPGGDRPSGCILESVRLKEYVQTASNWKPERPTGTIRCDQRAAKAAVAQRGWKLGSIPRTTSSLV